MINKNNMLFSLEQTREIEKEFFKIIKPYQLMKKAGHSAYKILKKHFPNYKKTIVLCGAGNNGGDGYILASYLKNTICLENHDVSQMTKESKKARELAKSKGVIFKKYDPKLIDKDALIIDAFLGIGLKGELKESLKKIINHINDLKNPVLSIDIPSGLNADTGFGNAIKADVTITFITKKQGLYLGRGKDFCGIIEYDDLGCPKSLLKNPIYYLLDYKPMIKDLYIDRISTSHKGNFGHLLCVGGNHLMPGAISMSAQAALRMGVGKVSVMTDQKNIPIISQKNSEIMFVNDEIPKDITAVLIGPGLGQDEWGKDLFDKIFKLNIPKVIDADAINILSKSSNIKLNYDDVLTPHPKEASRLLNISTDEIQDDRKNAIELLYKKYRCNVVLKGNATLIKNKDNICFLNPLGNPGMAKAGMGDILSGIVGGLLAQKINPIYGVSYHSYLGDLCKKEIGMVSMIASDLLKYIKIIL